MIKKYKKKPVVIEALLFNGQNHSELVEFMNINAFDTFPDTPFPIETLEGIMMANKGDYIIKGVKGEFYPCKPDIFKETYDEVRVMGLTAKEVLINELIKELKNKGISRKGISDGWHTFGELYYHRMILTAVIANTYKDDAWKSKQHHDGTMFEDSFIIGFDTPKGQYSYHYHLDDWELFEVKELEYAPVYDGHKPSDIERLISLLK